MAEKLVVVNDHEDKVEDLMKFLEDLGVTGEAVMSNFSGMCGYCPVVRLITEVEHLSWLYN